MLALQVAFNAHSTCANSVQEHFASRQTRTPVLQSTAWIWARFFTGSCNVLGSSRSI